MIFISASVVGATILYCTIYTFKTQLYFLLPLLCKKDQMLGRVCLLVPGVPQKGVLKQIG